MNPGFSELHAYPFERLKALMASSTPATKEPINFSIGEPKHPTPEFIQQALIGAINGTNHYPSTRGTVELRRSIAAWLCSRFHLPSASIDPDLHVLPVNGTREALFAIAQCVIDNRQYTPEVVMPNPFYQIYEGAALLAGAKPYFLSAANGFDFQTVPLDVWEKCQLLYVCSPSNPSGAVAERDNYKLLLGLAEQFGFIVVADECYSELYYDEQQPPVGLLQVANELGISDYRRCVVMHSLSKRSNAPGLRSGFVAGDAAIIAKFFQYRTYHGSAMPFHVQQASIAAWNDEDHVRHNRELYRAKFDAVLPILAEKINISQPAAGFYLWPELPVDDLDFCRKALTEENVLMLPGQFLAREVDGHNPGLNRVRLALVEKIDQCVEGATRLARII